MFRPIWHNGQTDEAQLKKLLEDHNRWTGSKRARELLDNWAASRAKFVKVFPTEYKRALAEIYERKVLEESATPAVAATKKKSRYPPNKGDPADLRTTFITRTLRHGKNYWLHGIRAHRRGLQARGERLKHYKEFVIGLDESQAKIKGARCMDCGTPFCNNGCPVNNIIPDFNDLGVPRRLEERDRGAAQHQQLPRVHRPHLPRACEAACVLNVNNDAVGIKSIEHAIIDRAWAEGWVQPRRQAQDGQEGGRGGCRPCGHGGGSATGPRGPRCDGV